MMLVLVPRRMEWHQLEENVGAAVVQQMELEFHEIHSPSNLMDIHTSNRTGGVFCVLCW